MPLNSGISSKVKNALDWSQSQFDFNLDIVLHGALNFWCPLIYWAILSSVKNFHGITFFSAAWRACLPFVWQTFLATLKEKKNFKSWEKDAL